MHGRQAGWGRRGRVIVKSKRLVLAVTRPLIMHLFSQARRATRALIKLTGISKVEKFFRKEEKASNHASIQLTAIEFYRLILEFTKDINSSRKLNARVQHL